LGHVPRVRDGAAARHHKASEQADPLAGAPHAPHEA
jgi:hypothetical protein